MYGIELAGFRPTAVQQMRLQCCESERVTNTAYGVQRVSRGTRKEDMIVVACSNERALIKTYKYFKYKGIK